jgi:Flp pilus assembly protein TadG
MRLEGQKTSVSARSLARLPGRPRCTGDDGTIIVEAAFLTPIFIVLIFGLIEFGGAFRDYLTVANGASQGTRMSAIQGNNSAADWETLQAIKKAMGAVPRSQITRIVIFTATGPSSTVPAACKTATSGVSGTCNIFFQSDLAYTTTPATWIATGTCGTTNPIACWPSTNRKVNLTVATGGPPDYVGIYIEVLHPWVTGLFGANITLSDTSITQLEPQKL